MEELYKVMDDLLEVEFQMKAGMDILKELEEFYMLEKETEKSDARKVAVLMKSFVILMTRHLKNQMIKRKINRNLRAPYPRKCRNL